MAAECWLFEEPRHEVMVLDNVDILFLESTLTTPDFLSERCVRILGAKGILARVVGFLVVRHRDVLVSRWFSENQRDTGTVDG